MRELLNKLKELSEKYKCLSDSLGLNENEEEYYEDCDDAIDDGKSQAYFAAHIELEELIKKYDK